MNGRFLLGLGLLTLVGCSNPASKIEKKPVYPVQGEVRIGGQAASGVVVTLLPEEPGAAGAPTAVSDTTGQFLLATYQPPMTGAPAGKYKVLLYWPKDPTNQEFDETEDKLQGRYFNPSTTTLAYEVTTNTNPPLKIDIP